MKKSTTLQSRKNRAASETDSTNENSNLDVAGQLAQLKNPELTSEGRQDDSLDSKKYGEIHQFVMEHRSNSELAKVPDDTLQLALSDIPGMIKKFFQGMWSATTWEGMADNLNFLVKLVTEFISEKGLTAKVIGLGTSFLASATAAFNSGAKGEWMKFINHFTKALTTLGAMYYEYYGGNVTAKIIIMLIDHTAKNLPKIVDLIKAGYTNASTVDDHRDDDLQNVQVVTV